MLTVSLSSKSDVPRSSKVVLLILLFAKVTCGLRRKHGFSIMHDHCIVCGLSSWASNGGMSKRILFYVLAYDWMLCYCSVGLCWTSIRWHQIIGCFYINLMWSVTLIVGSHNEIQKKIPKIRVLHRNTVQNLAAHLHWQKNESVNVEY
jgi:hypothetical protein